MANIPPIGPGIFSAMGRYSLSFMGLSDSNHKIIGYWDLTILPSFTAGLNFQLFIADRTSWLIFTLLFFPIKIFSITPVSSIMNLYSIVGLSFFHFESAYFTP